MRQDIKSSRLGRTILSGAPHLALATTLVITSLAPAPAEAQRAQSRSGGAESRASSSSPSGQSSGRTAVPRSSSSGSSASSSSGSHRRTGTSSGGRSSGRGRGYYPSYGYGYGSYYQGRYGYYGYPLYWGGGVYGHYPYHYYPYYGGYVVAGAGSAATRVPLGAIDVNVKPKKAQVFVDGRYVGLVKNFDGFPNYLWLEEGEYDLTFHLPGYANLTRRIQVTPGEVIDFRDRLSSGTGVAPEPSDEAPEDTPWENRPARVISDDESADNDLRGDPVRLRIDVQPSEASVYLDGRFLGSARELTNLRAPLIIDHGDHVLQVVHPDYPTEKVEFDADEGEELRVEVNLSTG